MRYIGRIFRPPSEAASLIVQATVGCSHNTCTFCDMYREKRFQVRPLADVAADLAWARAHYARIDRVFLADGDALICPTQMLVAILRQIRDTMPACERVTCYASPASIRAKTTDELSLLHSLGLSMVYLGLESGSDQVLAHVNKGFSAAQIIEAGQKVRQAGIRLSVTAISGLGGQELTEEHAVKTAHALSAINPEYIGLLTLMFEPGTPLTAERDAGTFIPLSAVGVAKETLLLLEHLDSPGSVFRANHASNYVDLKGTLNGDIPRLTATLKDVLGGRLACKPEQWRGL